MASLTEPSATAERRHVRVVAAGFLFVLFSAVVVFYLGVSTLPGEPEPEAPVQGASTGETGESERRQVIEGLVAVIEAQSRDGRPSPKVDAPPPRDRPPSRARLHTGAAERPPAPGGYAYANFEPAGTPVGSEDAGDEKERLPAPEWLLSPDSLAAVATNAESAGRGWSFGWVRLGADARLVDVEAELTALGVVVEGQAGELLRTRLPDDLDRLRATADLPGVDGLGAQPPSAKLPVAFAEEARGKPAGEIVPVFVTLAAADDNEGRWRAALERLGATVGAYDAHTRTYVANVGYGDLDALVAADFVAFVEPVSIVEAANDTAVPAMGADAYRTYTDSGGWAGTAGQGVAIGVMDTGLNINHRDIESGRLSVCGANFVSSLAEELDLWVDAEGHGTHVTATIVGSGTAEQRYAGMAPLVPHIRFAKVLHSRGLGDGFATLTGMDFLAEASECEAEGWEGDAVAPPIVNMSLAYASLTFEGRDTSARKLDAVVWDTGQLYVVANANEGVYGFSNYGAAKNSLPVGAAWDSGELVSWSSHGPTADGRLAPLVVGAGVRVWSARGNGSRGGYVQKSGTSMSSPAVAGVAALVMHAQPDFVGNAALTRAHLMSSAVKPDAWLDEEEAFPSDNTDGPGALHARYGLGKVSATTSVLDRPQADGWESGGWHGISLDTGETSEQAIDVPSDATRLDVVLTWDEPPADVIANTVLNDLDLWLEPPLAASRDTDLSSRSRRDNVEWIIVDNPQAGRWRVRVEAERIHGESPRAALAYTIIRGPSTPQLSIVADSDTLGANGDVAITVSTDGYVAAGTRLGMDCRTEDDEPCHLQGTWEDVREDAPAVGPQDISAGSFVALGEIRAGEPRTVRFAALTPDGNARVHFTVTGWNAKGDSTLVFAETAEGAEFAAPANDDFAAAADLDGRVEGDLLTATTESGEPAFQDGFERPGASAWYRWTAKADGAVHFSLSPAEAFSFSRLDEWYDEFEMRLGVYEGGSIAGALEVASAAWGVSFVAEEGVEYLVRVAGRSRAAPFSLSWRQGGPPANDAFDAAIALQGNEGRVEGTNGGATLERGELFGPLAATVWYEWTAPDDGWYEFGSSAAHLMVLAFRDAASVGDLRLVSGFPAHDMRFPARAGDTYRVVVAAPDAESAGTDFELSWSALEEYGSQNDLLVNADAFPDTESSTRWVRVESSATVEPGEPAESGIRTAWWSWTVPEAGEYTWRLGTDFVRLTGFEGDALDNLVAVGSNVGSTGEFTFVADEGETYRFAVAVAAEHAYTIPAFGGNVVWGPTPANDAYSRAVVLDTAAGTFAASNRYATVEKGERIHVVGHSSLWWSFEAPAPGWYRFWIDETWLPFTLSAYADKPGAPPGRLEMIASSERGFAVGVEIFVYAESAGERFAVRAGTRGENEGRDFTLNWASDEPVWLRYLGHTGQRLPYDDGETVQFAEFRSLAFDPTGRALYAVTGQGLAVFDRMEEGSLSLVDLIRGDDIGAVLLWDAPRNRLLAFGLGVVRSYTPVGGDVLDLEDAGNVSLAGSDRAWVRIDSTVLAHPTESFLYLVDSYGDMQVFSVDEDGGMAHVQTGLRVETAAVSSTGGHVFTVGDGILRVFESGATGALTEVASLSLPHAHDAVTVADDDSRVFALGRGGSSIVDVDDPVWPVLLGTTAYPREHWWSSAPACLIAAGRNGRPAADVFCMNGDAFVLAWRGGNLAITDLVAPWTTNRYDDVVPDFRTWWFGRRFAAIPDGRHAYVITLDHGIAVFERVGNAVPDDPASGAVTVTIAADASAVGEGMPADFTLTRSDSAGALTVNVDVTETGKTIDGTAPAAVTFDDGAATATLSVATEDDAADESDSVVTATVATGTGYAPGSPDSAMVTVTDDDPSSSVTDDHGDSPQTATSLSSLPWFGTAELHADTDRDVFRMDVPEPGMLTAYTTRATTPDADTYGVLTDDDGVVLDEDDNSGDGPNFEIEAAVDEGTHYVEVRGIAGQLTGSYHLFIELAVTGGATVAIGAQQVIATDADGAAYVYAADLDDDGDADVLSASRFHGKIAWHENQGDGAFSTQQVVTIDADGVRAVYAADLDGDGDADVLSGSFDDDQVAWYENQGGAFSAQLVIATRSSGFVSVHAADLDGDGDADVLGMSGDLEWYENLGNGEFSDPRTIGAGETGGHGSIHAVDLDGDGDQDVLSAGHADSEPGVAWYENDGEGSFSRRDFGGLANVVHPADLDGDGDPDVVVAHGSSNVAVVAWHENLGGGGFSTQRPITTVARGGRSLHAADIDGDGHVDVLSASYDDGKIAWYRNRGDGSFLGQHVIATTDGAESVDAVDLDGDGDPDVLSASQDNDTIAWYENLSDHGDDHGDVPDTATLAATLPALLIGNVESSGDKDVFRVATGSGTLSVSAHGPTDTFGRLLDAEGEELVANDDSDGLNFGIEAAVGAGVHYVEVGGHSTQTGSYTVSIEFVAD